MGAEAEHQLAEHFMARQEEVLEAIQVMAAAVGALAE